MMHTLNPLTDPRWETLTKAYETDVFHSVDWLNVLNTTYGFDLQALVIENDDNKLSAGLAYAHLDDAFGKRIISLPFSDFLDPLVQNDSDWQTLLAKLLAHNCPLRFRILHNHHVLTNTRLSKTTPAKWHAVDLQREPQHLWQNLHPSARRAIRKAQRQKLIIRVAQSKADLRAFYELHLGIRKHKYKLLAQPYTFFEAIWDNFIAKNKGLLLLAQREGQVIGGVMFLEWQNKLYYKFNASHPDFLDLRPNDLVIWEGMNYAQQKGLKYLDFGLSDAEQSSLISFKRKYATQEKDISFLQFQPNIAPSERAQELRQLLPKLTTLFVNKDVPDSVSEEAGALLYKLFT